jgi:hypothetical protein
MDKKMVSYHKAGISALTRGLNSFAVFDELIPRPPNY